MAKNYKNQKLIYHLTAMSNLPSILKNGLQSRAVLSGAGFTDVADHSILASRKSIGLEEHVPFHFFSRTPFDYAVMHKYPTTPFVVSAVHRNLAKSKNWKIVPSHPLCGAAPDIMDYEEGFNAINWELMHSEDYKYATHQEYKQTCMAECLSPVTVDAEKFHSIYVKTDADKATVQAYLKVHSLTPHVNVAPWMFAR
ncbi:MAG: hypothetical protein CMI67_22910 [Pelagibaca sp.]|nr:hypothetical protein [Pelagibaca sp.]